MRPELFALPLPFKTIPIHAYGTMVMIGFVLGIFVAVRRARASGIDPSYIVDLGLWTMVFGIAGARVLYLIQFRSHFDWTLFHLFGSGMRRWPTGLGLVTGVALFALLRRLRGRRVEDSVSAGWLAGPLGGVTFAVLGAWGGHVVGNLGSVDFGPLRIDKGGLVFYGGLIGAGVFCYLYLRRRGANIWGVADCIAPGLALGLAFGRIGCFLNGCCWGKSCDAPWSVRFPPAYEGSRTIPNPVFSAHVAANKIDSDALVSLPVHPTQLYASGGALILFLALTAYFRWRKANGEVFAVFALLYGVDRFIIEHFRADNDAILGGMTISQNISIGVFLFGILLLLIHRKRGDSRPPVQAASDPMKST